MKGRLHRAKPADYDAMSKGKYNFMWGQRQSAMLTEASILALGPRGSFLGKEIVRDDLQVIEEGVLGNYMTDEAVSDWREVGKGYRDREFTEKLLADVDALIGDALAFYNRVHREDLPQLSNEELAGRMERYQHFVQYGLAYFGTSTPSATYWVEERIKDTLRSKVGDREKELDFFVALSAPGEVDETMRERIDFLKLQLKEEVKNEELERYARSYPALFMNTYDEDEVIAFLRRRLREKKTKEAVDKEIVKMNETVSDVRARHREIYREVGDRDLEYYASILQQGALGRYRLKHVWSGAEYMCLGLLREVQRRVEISFEDFLRAYMFSDIDNFLRNGRRLSSKEIADRRRCIVFHWIDRELKLLFGQEAIDYKDKLIGTEEETVRGGNELAGQVASVGKVRGRARMVFVDDLKQFVKDSEDFQKGEILVTTMTSPIMIPIITKAAGIVTDEGGIASHAAVSAREFKIPCVVGTRDGTKVIKTGDEIEVDAEKGVVRVLRRNEV